MTFEDRLDRTRDMMRDRWDLLVCALPANVLMFSGYWPIVGTGLVCVERDGEVKLLVPEDEEDLAHKGWADEVATFKAGSLDDLAPPAQSIRRPLSRLVSGSHKRIAYESGEVSEPVSYAAMHLYQNSLPDLLSDVFKNARLESGDAELARLRALKTDDEIGRIRSACATAADAFDEGSRTLRAGAEEILAAQEFRRGLVRSNAERADGFVSCMSGANSGRAFGAFARSTHKSIERGDLVLTHCNSYADGYWTDITRTYVVGEPQERQERMFSAVSEARDAAFAAVRAGVAASEVDRAARETLAERGFGGQFKHGTGHGVGFGAIDAHALPRLHPKSPDRLEAGMVFNIEPGIYFPGSGGMRHCDMVALTDAGPELLTPFHPAGAHPVDVAAAQ